MFQLQKADEMESTKDYMETFVMYFKTLSRRSRVEHE
jgi:hypothetical protein